MLDDLLDNAARKVVWHSVSFSLVERKAIYGDLQGIVCADWRIPARMVHCARRGSV